MSKAKSAAELKAAATLHSLEQLVQENDRREQAAVNRGGGLHPASVLQHKLETFFRVSLGESRYMDYMQRYQSLRSGLLDELEGALNQRDLTEGINNFQLPTGRSLSGTGGANK